MARTNIRKNQLRFPLNSINRDLLWAKLVDHDTDLDALDTLTAALVVGSAGFLTADSTGRAIMANGYFDSTTASAKFSTKAIAGSLLADGGVGTAQVAAGAITGPKTGAGTILTTGTFVGLVSAGSIVLAGAKVNDVVVTVLNLTTPGQDTTHFESAITVAGHIAQSSGALSTSTFFAILQQQS